MLRLPEWMERTWLLRVRRMREVGNQKSWEAGIIENPEKESLIRALES